MPQNRHRNVRVAPMRCHSNCRDFEYDMTAKKKLLQFSLVSIEDRHSIIQNHPANNGEKLKNKRNHKYGFHSLQIELNCKYVSNGKKNRRKILTKISKIEWKGVRAPVACIIEKSHLDNSRWFQFEKKKTTSIIYFDYLLWWTLALIRETNNAVKSSRKWQAQQLFWTKNSIWKPSRN